MSFISQDDVKKLMAHPMPNIRATIGSKLAAMIDSPSLTPVQREMANDIIRLMARDVAVVVRRAVAHNLRNSKNLPHDVALKLAEDVEAVALPILTDSIVLTDDDLISILSHSSPVKQNAVAARPNISHAVSDAVINVGSEIVVATLMGNKTAQISDFSMSKAVDRFAESDLVKESMIKRPELPLVVGEKLALIVSDRLKEYLVANHELSPATAAEIMQQSRERAVIQLSHERSQKDIENLVAHMRKNGRLTPTLVVRALCIGNLPFFEMAMAAMAGIPLTNACKLIHDAGAVGLNSLCQKVEVPEKLMPLVRTALDVLYQLKLDGDEQDVKRFRAKVIERVLTQVEDVGSADMDYLLEQMR